MRALGCVFLIACGGGDGPIQGDPLIQSTLQGEFDNKPWTPMYGFGRTEDAKFGFYVGSQKISCADTFMGEPREGNAAAVGVPAPVMVGTNNSLTLQMVDVTDGVYTPKFVPGSLQVTTVNDTEVSAVFSFDSTVDGMRSALNGAVTMLRCP
jgi:hypothetical protein